MHTQLAGAQELQNTSDWAPLNLGLVFVGQSSIPDTSPSRCPSHWTLQHWHQGALLQWSGKKMIAFFSVFLSPQTNDRTNKCWPESNRSPVFSLCFVIAKWGWGSYHEAKAHLAQTTTASESLCREISARADCLWKWPSRVKDIFVDKKKGSIICTNSFVALAAQIAGVMLTVVREEFVKSHSRSCFCFGLVLNREYNYCHLDTFPSDHSSTAVFPGWFPELAAWCW